MNKSEEVNKYSLAKEIFEELLALPNLSERAITELEADLELCEKKIEETKELPASLSIIDSEAILFDAWTSTGMKILRQNEIEDMKNQCDLFIDDDSMLVYHKGEEINELSKIGKPYTILKCLLENRGKVNLKKLAEVAYPEIADRKTNKPLMKKLKFPVSDLRIILKSNGIKLSNLDNDEYRLLGKTTFALVKLKI